MNAALEKALYHLTQKSNLSDISVDELSHLVIQYPYFAPAQLALAVKLKADNSFQASAQLQKTAVYFANPNWLQYQLMNGEAKNLRIAAVDTVTTTIPTSNEPESTAPVAEEKAPEPTFEIDSNIEEYKAFIPHMQEMPTVESVKEMLHNIEEKKEEIVVVPEAIQEIPVEKPPRSFDLEPPSYTATVQQNDPLPPTFPGNFEKNIFDPSENQMEKYASLLSNQVSNFKKPVEENAKLDFEMEPYYTIDYFASQGIKADLTQFPQDKLTKQLLKFTDWLKQMKTVSPNPQDLGTDPELEKAIQGIAQTSNEAKEIATETMAEVFVKQGKIDKAVQLYIKLSFLDPEKSSYFAAKIQQLKGM